MSHATTVPPALADRLAAAIAAARHAAADTLRWFGNAGLVIDL